MRVNVSRLRDEDVAKSYAESVTCFNWPDNYDSRDIEGKWSAFRDAIQSAATVAIGLPSRCRTEWISDATLEIVDRQQNARLAGKMDEDRSLNLVRNRMFKDDRQRWFDGLSSEAEHHLTSPQMTHRLRSI